MLWVARLNTEGADVDVGREEVGDEDVRGQDLEVVVGDEGPQGELGALGNGAGEADDEGEDGGGEGCGELEPTAQRGGCNCQCSLLNLYFRRPPSESGVPSTMVPGKTRWRTALNR